ncbi:MAG: 3-hydroxyacyl-ACP dehydratase FabZ [Pseudomonadota bacterium]|nr:3-hydroxyacyl-ACP dehydratase FabZ [Pseudomonadota bacterium]
MPLNKEDHSLNTMEIAEVLEYLPHRYPFLLIDRVLDCEPGRRLTGLKNVTINEPFFQGHFPRYPIMPGVLILEALAQATGILAFKTEDRKPADDAMYYFVGIDNARFKRPVVPGDQLILDVTFLRTKRGIWMFTGEARVDDKVAASAELMCTKRGIGL